MKILTTNPILYDNYSNGSGMDDDTKKALIGTGIATAGAVAVGLAQKGKKPLSDVEQRCGKKPWFLAKKSKKRQWEQCASQTPSTPTPSGERTQETPKKNNTNIMIFAIGGLVIIGAIIYANRKK